MSDKDNGFVAFLVGGTVAVVGVIGIAGRARSNAEEEKICYPYNKVVGFNHGEHHFAVCAREHGLEVRLIK